MHPRDLEKMLHRELQRLPAPRAPETLLPRVLAAVQAWARRPWYARAWFTWPIPLQAGSIVALLLLVVGAAEILPAAKTAALDAAVRPAAIVAGPAQDAVRRAEASIEVLRVLWRALLEPLEAYLFALIVAMCFACAAFGMAVNRLVTAHPFNGQGASL